METGHWGPLCFQPCKAVVMLLLIKVLRKERISKNYIKKLLIIKNILALKLPKFTFEGVVYLNLHTK